ncbi:hypothetical protein [uncultured Cytophaga sp.]|uniref:hypothetical protein n=1 Tax=uncultured Cytophaga sp. TaxID=160238 RepID=UPI002628D29F|nr:hypothetical protein [uncultured Cytophaga sp.]
MAFIKNKIILLITSFVISIQLQAIPTHPDTVKVGSYILSLHDINFHDKEYTMRFWLWFLYNNKDFDFTNQVELPNAKSLEKPEVQVDTINGKTWVLMKMKSVMKQSWNVNDYPFDEQHINVSVENTLYDKNWLVFEVDSLGSNFAPTMNVDGWKIKDFKVMRGVNEYQTAFGDPRVHNNKADYDTFNIKMTLERNAMGLFMKIFLGMYIAFFIGSISFFIDLKETESRFALPVGGLFAAVGNKYIIDSLLPETSEYTLVDTLHSITFLFIFFTIFLNAYCIKLYEHNKLSKAFASNYYGSRIMIGSYLILNIFFVSMAAFF